MTGIRKCNGTNAAGQPCGRAPILGGTVCPKHGGNAPQTKRKAAERLEEARQQMLEMVHPALREMRILLEGAESESVQLAAIRDLLDRVGLGATRKSEATVTVHDGDSDLDRSIEQLLADMAAGGQGGAALAADGTSQPAAP